MYERAHISRDTWAEKGVFTEAPDRYTVGHRWKGMMTCAMKEKRLPPRDDSPVGLLQLC
jgi:hypothetical protein